MAKCDPNETIPRSCADAFQRIAETQASHGELLKSIHSAAQQTNGTVRELSVSVHTNDKRIGVVESDVKDCRQTKTAWGRRLWQLVVGVGLLLAGYLLKS